MSVASLPADKLHALLQRKYSKGCDLFDLLWYLSDPYWPPPNLVMLNHALQHTGWTGPALTAENWRTIVQQALQQLDWGQVLSDVQPSLEPGFDAHLLTQENLERILLGMG